MPSRTTGAARARASLDVTNPRAVFVWAMEAQEALSALATVAEDAIRPAARRKLSRREARALYAAARATMATLAPVGVVDTSTPAEPTTPGEHAPLMEAWCE